MRLSLLIGLLVLLVVPLTSNGQSIESMGQSGAPFTISVNPQYPAPFGQVVLTPLSDSLDLSRAEMSITVNGKETYQGNARSVAAALGGAGSANTIKVTISVDGKNHVQTLLVQPQDVLLITEPVASVPPLYPGKPAVPLEGTVRVIAMANLKGVSGAAPNPATFSYAWNVDGAQIASASGIGKRVLMVASPLQYRDRTVSVAVTSADGTLVGGSSTLLNTGEPRVRMYENDPLLGIRFERAISGTHTMPGAESTFYAAPFSFSTNAGVPEVQWFVNGKNAQTGNFVTLRPSGEGEGRATLSATASAGDFSKAAASFTLLFGAVRTSFFGL